MQDRLIEVLTNRFQIQAEDVREALTLRNRKGSGLGDILIQKKLLSEEKLLEAFSLVYGIPYWPDLPLENICSEFIKRLPIGFLKKHIMIPLWEPEPALNQSLSSGPNGKAENPDRISSKSYIVAVRSLSSLQAVDDLVRIMGIEDYRLVLSTRGAILSAINMSFELCRDSAEQIVQDMEEDGKAILSEIKDRADLLDDTSDAPIVKLVNHIISQAVKARASDIHVEPYHDSFKIRYRIDGILYDTLTPPKWIQPALISRIKIMTQMNIAEKRLPQDGRFDVKVGDQEIDIRVSTIPTAFGERVVLRLLNKSSSLLKLTEIGLEAERLAELKSLIQNTNGVILITGPTGSGKTTTLYAVLSFLNTPGINIITIEDPVEYQIKGINQIQVNPKIDLTFARGLRHIVRQDPDVILVGEIRDLETAEIAVQSALTGHLVFSTLHTNDSASAITRLVDIGIEPFLISSSVKGVAAQRLIRVLCNECKEPYTPDEAALQAIGIPPDKVADGAIYRSVGCPICFQTGYRGRIGIFEVMTIDSTLSNLLLKTYDANRIKAQAVEKGMVALREDGIRKVLKGITTIEEVLRVTQK
jgi:general secretion pathway protein E